MCKTPMPKPTFWQMQHWRTPRPEGFALYEGASRYATISIILNAILIYGILSAPAGTLEKIEPLAIFFIALPSLCYAYPTCRALLCPLAFISPDGICCAGHKQYIPWSDIASCTCRKEYLAWGGSRIIVKILMTKKKKVAPQKRYNTRVKMSPMGNIKIDFTTLPSPENAETIEDICKYYRSQALSSLKDAYKSGGN